MRFDVPLLMCFQLLGCSYLFYALAVLREDYFIQISGKQFANECVIHEGLSDIKCARACHLQVIPYRCVGANYNILTGECGLSNSQSEIQTDPDDGKIALQRVVCAEDLYLVSGPNGVPDNFLKATSHYYNGPGTNKPHMARLTNTATTWQKTAWATKKMNLDQWIEARFHNLKTVKGIAIQGRQDSVTNWVTEFRVSYSADCIDFQDFVTCNGTAMNFDGNSDKTTIVTQTLPAPVTALCVRLNPRKWNGGIALRFDIIGC